MLQEILSRARSVAPFRPFFLLVALDAMLGAAAWLPLALGVEAAGGVGSAAEWHRDVLLFGTIPAMLAGFLLTAMPRWTGRPAVPAAVTWSLVALWLGGRGAYLLVSPAAGLALACLFCLALALIVAGTVLAAGDRRNRKVALLLLVFCAGAILATARFHAEPALRAALASIVGLLTIIAGRVTPALTMSFAERAGDVVAIRFSRAVERVAAIAAAVALCAWVVAPEAAPTALLSVLAAVAQAGRVLQWRGWRVRAQPVLALHAGYGWIVAGFALLAIHILAPAWIDRFAAVHAWTIGATGTLGLAIMTSMIRKHSNRAFRPMASVTAAFVLVTVSCLSRLLAGPAPGDPSLWTGLSAASLIAAFSLFLVSFARMRRPAA